VAPTDPYFRPHPVERPGGGRVRDKTPPAPADLVQLPGLGGRPISLHRLAAQAWKAMVEQARAEGLEAPLLLPVSGYRNPEEQEWLWQGALAKYGDPDVACLWVARPGTSAHQSGRAVDLHLGYPIESEYVEDLRRTAAWQWLCAHAEQFGFYPYDVEPWHWEYNPPWDSSGHAPGSPPG
jgi:D-alanyl-D-alanine carboxypeptidase